MSKFELGITLPGFHFYLGPLDYNVSYGVVVRFGAEDQFGDSDHVWRWTDGRDDFSKRYDC